MLLLVDILASELFFGVLLKKFLVTISTCLKMFWGFPRFEACGCIDNKVEKLSTGGLDQLLPYIPALRDLYTEGSNCNFKIQLPDNLSGSRWFTKSTFNKYIRYAYFDFFQY